MPIIRFALLIPLLLLSVASPARPQAAPARLAAAGLQADVDVLEQAYQQLHPGLYRYNTPAQMAAHFRDLRKSLDHNQSLADAYLAFSIFAAKVECGHTYANFFNQPESIAQLLFRSSNRVPFQFRWLDGRMVITRNLSTDASLVPGTEVLSIDGIAASKILARLLSVARADGSNDAKRVVSMDVQGNDRYEAFDIFLPLFYPHIGAQQTFVVKSPTDAVSRPVTVAALSYAERQATLSTPIEDNAPAFTAPSRRRCRDTRHARMGAL